MAVPKPPAPRTTTGNVYTSPSPPKRNPNIVGRYKRVPKVNTKLYTVKKRGGGRGYVTIKKPPKAPAAASPAAAPPGPYDAFKGIPGAVEALTQMDRDQAAHQAYASDKVAPWLSAGLTGLNQFNTDAQNQYLGNLQGGQVAGAMAPLSVQGNTPGGIVAAPNSYLTGAGQQYAQSAGSTALQLGQYQAAMNKMAPVPLSEGFLATFADKMAGLPELYTQRRSAYIDKLQTYIAQQAADQAKLEETARHNRVTEAISATNAQTNAAFQASRLGLSASSQGFDQATQTTAAATPAPPGYLRDPATGKLYRDPSVPNATSGGSGGTGPGGRRPTSTRDAQGRYLYPSEHGFTIGGWKVRPKGIKNSVTQGADGKWYAKPGQGAAAPSATQVAKAQGANPNDVFNKLTGSVKNLAIADTQDPGTGDILRILRTMQPTNKANFAKWLGATLPVLKRVDPNYADWIVGWITRRKADGTWKGTL